MSAKRFSYYDYVRLVFLLSVFGLRQIGQAEELGFSKLFHVFHVCELYVLLLLVHLWLSQALPTVANCEAGRGL